VVHVRDAEQAKPHLEHNPLSLLGACYATPRRKLNDPGQLQRVLANKEKCRVLQQLTQIGGVQRYKDELRQALDGA